MERAIDDKLQSFFQTFVDELVEEFHFFRALFDSILNQVLDEFLSEIHIALQIAKGHFGLDHPELTRVTGRVGILRAKGWSESVDIGQGTSKDLCSELAADREIGRFPQEILAVVD